MANSTTKKPVVKKKKIAQPPAAMLRRQRPQEPDLEFEDDQVPESGRYDPEEEYEEDDSEYETEGEGDDTTLEEADDADQDADEEEFEESEEEDFDVSEEETDETAEEEDDDEDLQSMIQRGRRMSARKSVSRTSRTQERRDNNPVRTKPNARRWKQPLSLDAPKARPGLKYRWVNTMDERNLSKRLREGWTPVKLKDVPANFHAPSLAHGRFKGCVEVVGMVLCKIDAEIARQRKAYYQQKSREQIDRVSEVLENANRRGAPYNMKVWDRSVSTVEKGAPRRKQPRISDD